jgi:threonine dehydrogenase-like Zn-dependent dehydrogenase
MDSSRVLGAAKVTAIDKEPYRLQLVEQAGHTPVNFDEPSPGRRRARGPMISLPALGAVLVQADRAPIRFSCPARLYV